MWIQKSYLPKGGKYENLFYIMKYPSKDLYGIGLTDNGTVLVDLLTFSKTTFSLTIKFPLFL